MSPLEIALMMIGIITIIVSSRMIDQSGKTEKKPINLPFSFDNNVTEEDKSKLMDKLKDLLTDISEETIIRTDDTLSKLSNEKIMVVSEFSDQILEKIKRNHEEVIFLYNMLNDKEKELKAAVKEIDSSKKIVQDILVSKASAEKTQATKNSKNQLSEKSLIQASQIDKQGNALHSQAPTFPNTPVLNSLSSNNNTQILALYSQGKTVMEISKILGLGQGEVKLVIDLFKGKK